MSEIELATHAYERSLIWSRLGPIADDFEFLGKYLDKEAERKILAKQVELKIMVAEHRLETLKMISQMLKTKG